MENTATVSGTEVKNTDVQALWTKLEASAYSVW